VTGESTGRVCRRCGCPEEPAHVHGFDGVRTYCGTCGREACPAFLAPLPRWLAKVAGWWTA
jgi:hypothetical protein